MQDKPYKITQVQKRDEWQSNYGPMQNYALQLENEEGWVQLSQKPETAEPSVGAELFGHIEVQTRGDKTFRKFKKAQRQDGGAGNFGGGSSKADTEYIVMMLEELTGRRDKPESPTGRESEPTVEELGEEIDLDEIPF